MAATGLNSVTIQPRVIYITLFYHMSHVAKLSRIRYTESECCLVKRNIMYNVSKKFVCLVHVKPLDG